MSDEKARLFVALELPGPVRDELLSWRERAFDGVHELRLVPAAALHVTLCFLGWRIVGEIGDISAACAAVVGRATRGLSLGEGLWLPERGPPRVASVRVADPEGSLSALQGSLSTALADGGWYAPEARPYLAHVTVARVAKRARVRRWDLPPPRQLEFAGEAVTLYRSRLAASGARYEPLQTFPVG